MRDEDHKLQPRMNRGPIFILFTVQPMLCKLIGSLLILDVVEIHLIKQNSDGDLTLDPLEIRNSECEYGTILLDRSTDAIAIKCEIG